MIFLQFGKQDSRYKTILSSIVLSQQCCVFHPFYSSKAAILDYQTSLKSPP